MGSRNLSGKQRENFEIRKCRIGSILTDCGSSTLNIRTFVPIVRLDISFEGHVIQFGRLLRVSLVTSSYLVLTSYYFLKV